MYKDFFFQCKGVKLKPIQATNEMTAWDKLTKLHTWIGATKVNTTLLRFARTKS